MKETQEILKQMGFENPNDNVWKADWFGYFILTADATPDELVRFIWNRGYRKGFNDASDHFSISMIKEQEKVTTRDLTEIDRAEEERK